MFPAPVNGRPLNLLLVPFKCALARWVFFGRNQRVIEEFPVGKWADGAEKCVGGQVDRGYTDIAFRTGNIGWQMQIKS